jgi:hypothetical protein
MGRARLAAFVAPAAILLLATLGCRQLVGIGDAPPQGPASLTEAGAEGGFTYGQGDCEACVADQCTAQALACARLPSCSALEECMSGCNGDATCRAQCGVDHGLGNDMATPAFEACLAGSCADACGLTCGGLAAVFPPATATACQGCIVQGECASTTACATDPECQAAVRCDFSTHTPDVEEACPVLVMDAGGAPLGTVNTSPIASSCSAECSWGSDWSCVGRVDWPLATLGSIEFDIGIIDIASQAPVDQATVLLCDSTDLTCSAPFARGTTGDAGTLVLDRPPVKGGILHYLDISSPSLVPTLVFDVFPISEPRLTTNDGTLTPVELATTASGLGMTLDPTLGILLVYAFDCRLGGGTGVQLSLTGGGPTTKLFYIRNGFPSLTATATDYSGLAVFVNVPVIPPTVTINVMPNVLDGGVSGSMEAFTRPGGLSTVYAVPTP